MYVYIDAVWWFAWGLGFIMGFLTAAVIGWKLFKPEVPEVTR